MASMSTLVETESASMHNYIAAAEVLVRFVEFSSGLSLPMECREKWRVLMQV